MIDSLLWKLSYPESIATLFLACIVINRENPYHVRFMGTLKNQNKSAPKMMPCVQYNNLFTHQCCLKRFSIFLHNFLNLLVIEIFARTF